MYTFIQFRITSSKCLDDRELSLDVQKLSSNDPARSDVRELNSVDPALCSDNRALSSVDHELSSDGSLPDLLEAFHNACKTDIA